MLDSHQSNSLNERPISGIGIGLRASHYNYILANHPNVPWFEVLTDNYLGKGGPPLRYLEAIAKHYPITFHGVGLSIGSTDPLNTNYLQELKTLASQFNPALISDHLCWISTQQEYLHELMPLPYTEEAIAHVATRVQQVQEFLGRRIMLENVSSYLEYKTNEMPEWQFINAVASRADCYILLDINNIYVSAYNHQFNANDYLYNIDKTRVKQFHLAGYSEKNNFLFDSHDHPVHPPVWDLYRQAVKHFGHLPTLIEWDDHIPEFSELMQQALQADAIAKATTLETLV